MHEKVYTFHICFLVSNEFHLSSGILLLNYYSAESYGHIYAAIDFDRFKINNNNNKKQ